MNIRALRIKKKNIFIITLIFLVSLILIINRDNIIYNFGKIREGNEMATSYATVTDFQNARWAEIQSQIFGTTSSISNTSLSTTQVIAGNSYFNWVDTSVLGIKQWDGTTNKSTGTSYKKSDFYNAEGIMDTETVTYTTNIAEGVVDTREVTYEVYHVYDANQLRYVLTSTASTSENKKIYIENDIDLGGENNLLWNSISTSGGDMYIEGNNHTIYNLNSNTSGLFSRITTYMTILNLNIKSIKIVTTSDSIASIGQPLSGGIRFENVHVDEGFIQSSASNAAGFIARPRSVNTFIKDCSTSNLYLYGAGEHTSGFSGCICPVQGNFKGGYGVKYTVEYPEQPEALFGNESTSLNTSDSRYPFYITDCYSIDCEIFSTKGHSGGLISCIDSGLVCKNSFSNNSIYGESAVGVLMGCQVAASRMALYDDANQQTINAYFENCYTSGVVEGKTSIGGFIGADNDGTGASIYKNCYSTSMVGMDYSGTNVGGFIGYTSNSATTTYDTFGTVRGIILQNCYAAGEVGNIGTSTDIDVAINKRIGGFMGSYSVASYLNIHNCYYDKQTTAMREIAVGNTGNNGDCQLNGVTGVYTKPSELKGVEGLTDIDMQDGSAWMYREGYYPQLRAFTDFASTSFTNSGLVESYSAASTATVFLDHYDEVMNENGDIVNSADAIYIYDTIRDITSIFELTSNENSSSPGFDLTWAVDSETNSVKGYTEELKITEEDGTIKTVPVLSIQNPVKNQIEGAKFGLDTADIYKCYDFAPGKSWVKITVENTLDNDVFGTRKLRLLPTAYIDAGNYTEITLVTDGTEDERVVQNQVEVEGKTGIEDIYKHAQDSMYVITDEKKLADNEVVYPGQVVSKDRNETNLFALWNRYPSDLNASSVTTQKFDSMYDQALIGNSKDTGLAKVEVYNLGVSYRDVETEEGTVTLPVIDYDKSKRITAEALNDSKWRGEELFDKEDAGWYELKYYWRLNDGRYLTDSKIVVIKGNEISATLNNIIIKGESDYNSEQLQITPDIRQNTENTTDLTLNHTKTEEDKRGVETTVTATGTVEKTIKIQEFVDDTLITGWKNDPGYVLIDLEVEVSRDGAAWVTLPLNLETSNTAEYTYTNQNWQVRQYTDTKEYYIDPTGEPIETTLRAVYETQEVQNSDYTKFKFETDSTDSSDLVTNSNIRVTATFAPVEEITVTKEWVDDSNILNLRPTSIVLKVVGSDGSLYSQSVSGNTTSNENWNYTFEVPSYDESENKITYTIDEEIDSLLYDKSIDQQNNTITNEIIKYNITTNVEGVGGTISGQDEQIYEQVVKGTSSTKDIVISPQEGYEIESIKINGVEQQLPIPSERANPYTLPIFTNMSEDKNVVVTFRENKINIQVTKNWIDNSNEAQKRPDTLIIDLYANSVYDQSYTILDTKSSNSQTYTFQNLPKYDNEGNEITYTVDEREVNTDDLKLYVKTIDNDSYVITNTFTVPDEKIEVNFNKIWEDNNNAYGKRPTSIKAQLKNGDSLVEEIIISGASNQWTYMFSDIAKYDSLGNVIEYTIDEAETYEGDLKFYSKNVNNETNTITNTFTVPDEKIEIVAQKEWIGEPTTQRRPESVILVVKYAGVEVQEQEVSENTDWKATFTNLPKYNERGNEITYTIDEKEKNTGDLEFYIKTINNNNYTVSNTFTVPDEKITFTVTKVWVDNSNEAQKRPNSILLELYANDVFLKSQQVAVGQDTQEYTFENLDKYDDQGNEIKYTVIEKEINTDDLKFYSSSIDNTTNTITNTFTVPDEKVNVSVTKVWVDNSDVNGRRPQSLKLLVRNGTEEVANYIIDTSEENRTYTFIDLPKYNELGNEIVYTVDEEEVNEGDLEFYSKQINGSTITNTFTVPEDKVSFTVTKEWNDNDNYAQKRPQSIIVVILDGTQQIQEKTLSLQNEWKCEFTDLPKYNSAGEEINYVLAEKEASLGDLYFYETEVDNGNVKLTNTFRVPDERVSVTATKVWDDNNDNLGKRPDSVILQLYANSELSQSYTITDTTQNTQEYTFENLPKYDELGNVIIYTVDEKEVNVDDLKFYKKTISGTTITNTFTIPDERITYTVQKIWEDNSNSALKRPDSIMIELYANNVYKESGIINTTVGDSQEYVFENLARYDSLGNEISYTIKEVETAVGDLKFYTTQINENIVTNTFTVPDEKVEINGTKKWIDNSNEAQKRPDTLIIDLYANGHYNQSYTITDTKSQDIQDFKFENLSKYDERGNEIVYTVDERESKTDDLKFYKKTISGTTITNTFTVPDEKVSVTVTKNWIDNSTIRRPNQIKLILTDEKNVKAEEYILDVDENATQTYTFENLAKYDSLGNEKTYVVSEEEVIEGDLYFYSTQVDTQTNTITNTFVLPDDKVNITVQKVWNDNDNKARKRPTSVILQIKNGDIVVDSKTVNSSTQWKNEFIDLPKYDEIGQEIIYTIDEKESNTDDLKFYVKTIDNENRIITNTFNVPDDTTQLTVTKVWEDNQDELGKRPQSILIDVKNGTQTVKTEEITGEGDTWNYTITDLAVYDENGDIIRYTVDERAKNTGELLPYNKTTRGYIITNTLKSYNITTVVNGEGGTISGQSENPYEVVYYGQNSLKDILITPEYGYKISNITVNGNQISFVENADGTYLLDKFTNVTENKEVIVTFEKKDTSVLVKHQTEEGEDLKDPYTIDGKVWDEYTTTPLDLDNYELVVMPDNANGQMTEEQIEVVYIYKLVKGSITVTKLDRNNNEIKLQGAKYKIEKIDAEGNVDETFTSYEVVTDEEGIAQFNNLLIGKYRLTEIQAPERYELLEQAIELEITKENKEHNIEATDRLKLILPNTGSINYTIVMVIIGTTLIFVSVILFNTKKKKMIK